MLLLKHTLKSEHVLIYYSTKLHYVTNTVNEVEMQFVTSISLLFYTCNK